jgi:hypothetical protein
MGQDVGGVAGGTLADRFRAHFGSQDHLYAVLLARMADDWEAGGVTREIFDGWQDAPAQLVPQLRMLAGLFRIVLRGEAPQLEGFYPALGGALDPRDAWDAARPALQAHRDELRSSLDVAPQTNEPARTLALLVGVSEAVRRRGLHRVRLLEPGASGGLGLLVDRYRFVGEGWSAGPVDAGLVVPDCGAPGFRPETFQVVDRRGCDLAPVDTAAAEGGVYLTSFVWPWQRERHARLAAALAVAREHPVVVDRAPASQWVAERLAEPVPDGVLTVVWHSVTRMYWPAEETAAVQDAVRVARGRMPLAHVAFEHDWAAAAGSGSPGLPRVELDGEVLGVGDHHGPPVRLSR